MILQQKRSCSSNNHVAVFCHFLLGLEYQVQLQTSAQSYGENWHADKATTDSKVRTNAPFRPTKRVIKLLRFKKMRNSNRKLEHRLLHRIHTNLTLIAQYHFAILIKEQC